MGLKEFINNKIFNMDLKNEYDQLMRDFEAQQEYNRQLQIQHENLSQELDGMKKYNKVMDDIYSDQQLNGLSPEKKQEIVKEVKAVYYPKKSYRDVNVKEINRDIKIGIGKKGKSLLGRFTSKKKTLQKLDELKGNIDQLQKNSEGIKKATANAKDDIKEMELSEKIASRIYSNSKLNDMPEDVRSIVFNKIDKVYNPNRANSRSNAQFKNKRQENKKNHTENNQKTNNAKANRRKEVVGIGTRTREP